MSIESETVVIVGEACKIHLTCLQAWGVYGVYRGHNIQLSGFATKAFALEAWTCTAERIAEQIRRPKAPAV
jgi:hypothetical protein